MRQARGADTALWTRAVSAAISAVDAPIRTKTETVFATSAARIMPKPEAGISRTQTGMVCAITAHPDGAADMGTAPRTDVETAFGADAADK